MGGNDKSQPIQPIDKPSTGLLSAQSESDYISIIKIIDDVKTLQYNVTNLVSKINEIIGQTNRNTEANDSLTGIVNELAEIVIRLAGPSDHCCSSIETCCSPSSLNNA